MYVIPSQPPWNKYMTLALPNILSACITPVNHISLINNRVIFQFTQTPTNIYTFHRIRWPDTRVLAEWYGQHNTNLENSINESKIIIPRSLQSA